MMIFSLPSDLLAALLYAQFVRFDEIMEKRMTVWNTYAEGLEGLLADVVQTNVDLDPALAVHKVGKDGLAHSALCHNSSGDGGLLIFESIEIVLYILRICRSREFCDMEGVFTLVAEGGKLISSNL